MFKKEKILLHINRAGKGLEIGPSINPIAPKNEGFDVEIIDYLSKSELVEKYSVHQNLEARDIEKIEEVDYVWQGQSYAELIGKSKYYDWIIASHVVEHTTDLVHFINDCDELLKDDGVLALVVPDKRCCFDCYRAITGISQIIDSHYNHNTLHSAGTVADYFLNVVAKDGLIAWTASQGGKVNLLHTVNDAAAGIDQVRQGKQYLDVHAWVFTPSSFRMIMHDLFILGLIKLREVTFYPTVGTEFYVFLGRKGTGPELERLELLQKIDSEVSVKHSQGKIYKLWLTCSQRLMHYYYLLKRGIKKRVLQIQR